MKKVIPRFGIWSRIVPVMAVLLVLFAFPAAAKISIPDPTDNFYVGDFANVLKSDTVSTIVEKNEGLYERTGAQIVVVTVDFLDGADISDYARELFNQWKIGSSERNNGVLLLLAVGEDNYWAVQGSGLEDSLSSGTLGDLLSEYLEPDFAAGNYDSGVKKTFAALYDEVSALYPSGGTGIVQPVPEETYPQENYPVSTGFHVPDFGIAIIVFIIIVIVASSISGGRRRGYRPYRQYPPPPPNPFGHYSRGGYYPPRRPAPPPPPPFRRDPPSGGFGGFGSFSSGGSTRGGGAGRSSSFGRSSGFGGSSHSSFGGSSHSGGGGSTRGGGAGRR